MSAASAPRASERRPFQGVANIVRFNAPTYVAAGVVFGVGVVVAVVAVAADHGVVAAVAAAAALSAAALSLGSLFGSYLAYDASGLYAWTCLAPFVGDHVKVVAHVHTGLDESTEAFQRRFPDADVVVFDASADAVQTEPSIARARRLVPLHPQTIAVGMGPLPLPQRSAQLVILPMAAHEVRDDDVRAGWLRTLARSLDADGRMLIIEHLRDLPNAVAFHVGVLHFLSRRTWLSTFAAAGLDVVDEVRPAPLLRLFVLAPHSPPAPQPSQAGSP